MVQPLNPNIIRKSIAVLIFRLVALQAIVALAYIGIRMTKLVFFRELYAGDDYHNLNFWLGITVFILIVLVQSAVLIAVVLQWYYEFYEIKKDLIVHTTGVFRRKEDIYSLKTIEAGNVEQSLPGKIMNYGTVKIYSPVLKREYSLTDIPNPRDTRTKLLALLGRKDDDSKKIIPKEYSHS